MIIFLHGAFLNLNRFKKRKQQSVFNSSKWKIWRSSLGWLNSDRKDSKKPRIFKFQLSKKFQKILSTICTFCSYSTVIRYQKLVLSYYRFKQKWWNKLQQIFDSFKFIIIYFNVLFQFLFLFFSLVSSFQSYHIEIIEGHVVSVSTKHIHKPSWVNDRWMTISWCWSVSLNKSSQLWCLSQSNCSACFCLREKFVVCIKRIIRVLNDKSVLHTHACRWTEFSVFVISVCLIEFSFESHFSLRRTSASLVWGAGEWLSINDCFPFLISLLSFRRSFVIFFTSLRHWSFISLCLLPYKVESLTFKVEDPKVI